MFLDALIAFSIDLAQIFVQLCCIAFTHSTSRDRIGCGTIDGVALHSIGRTTALFVPHLPVIVIIAMIKYILQLGQIYLSIWKNTFPNLDKYIFQLDKCILQLGQIHFAIWINILVQFGQIYFPILTNTLSNFDKYILQPRQIQQLCLSLFESIQEP